MADDGKKNFTVFFKGDKKKLSDDVQAIDKSLGGLTKSASDMSRKMGVAFTAMGGALVGALGLTIQASAESEQAQAQLAAVLTSTSAAAGLTADELNKMSEALSRQTTFDDEAITGAQSLLLTFTKIGKEVFPEAIKTILDMSQALDNDLKTSTTQLGKALNDPIAGVSALTKVGVTFTLEQKKQIKTMVESNNIMGAQKIILAELATEFGGSATAAAGTLTGQFTQLKNEFGNLLEEIGNALTGGGGIAGLITMMKQTVMAATDWIKSHPELIASITKVSLSVGALMVALGPLLIALPGISVAFKGITTALGLIAPATTSAQTGLTLFGGTLGGMVAAGGLFAIAAAAIGATTKAWFDMRTAQDGALQSIYGAEAAENKLITTLKSKGMAIDEVALKEMTGAERSKYLSEQALLLKQKEANERFKMTAQFTSLTDQEILSMNRLSIEQRSQVEKWVENNQRKGVSEAQLSEGVRNALEFMTKKQGEFVKEHTNLTEQEIVDLKKLESERQTGIDAYVQQQVKAGAEVDKITQGVREMLMRFSLDHKESPSVNDMAAQSFAGYAGLLEGLKGSVDGIMSGIREMFTSIWDEMLSFAETTMASIISLAKQAASAMGDAMGLGDGIEVPGAATGGHVQRGGLAMVGERGPELVQLPTGARIRTAQETAGMMGGDFAGAPVSIQMGDVVINNPQVRSDADIKAISRLVSREQYSMLLDACSRRGFRPQST
jgi:hypothetical protein